MNTELESIDLHTKFVKQFLRIMRDLCSVMSRGDASSHEDVPDIPE